MTATRRLTLEAQTVAAIAETMPPTLLRHPGSRAFRVGLAEAARRRGLAVTPSRSETRRAVAELARSGAYSWATASAPEVSL